MKLHKCLSFQPPGVRLHVRQRCLQDPDFREMMFSREQSVWCVFVHRPETCSPGFKRETSHLFLGVKSVGSRAHSRRGYNYCRPVRLQVIHAPSVRGVDDRVLFIWSPGRDACHRTGSIIIIVVSSGLVFAGTCDLLGSCLLCRYA